MICCFLWRSPRCRFLKDSNWNSQRRKLTVCGFVPPDTSTRCRRRACEPELCPAPSPTPPPPAPAGPSHLVGAFLALSSQQHLHCKVVIAAEPWSFTVGLIATIWAWEISNVEQTLTGSHVSKVREALSDILPPNIQGGFYVISTRNTFLF